VVAGFLNSFIRHADVIKIANLAQIVNVIAPLLTSGERLLHQSIYYPVLLFASRRNGVALRPVVHGPGYESRLYGFSHYIDSSAILGGEALYLFLINRSLDEAATVETNLAGIQLKSIRSAEVVTGPSVEASNSFESPGVIRNQPFRDIFLDEGNAKIQMPPLSIAAISFEVMKG